MNTTNNKLINCYGIYISNKYSDYITIHKLQKNIYQMMNRIIKNDIRFKDISFIIGISNTEEENAKIIYIKTLKKGRPKKAVIGDKIEWHFHIYSITEKKYLSTFCNIVRKKLNKKGYITKQLKNNSVKSAINYTTKQCQNIWCYGDYFKSQNIKHNTNINKD